MLFSLVALLGFNSCEDDDSDSVGGDAIIGPGTVYTRISTSGSTTSLEAALNAASGELATTLEGTGPYTVFAPNDGAFTALAESLGYESTDDVPASDALLADIDPSLLSEILSYHVVQDSIVSGSLTDGSTLSTVSGDNLSVILTADGQVQLQDATKLPETNPVSNIVQANTYADNGVVHIIDRVLIPQGVIDAIGIDIRPTLSEWVMGTDDLSMLASAIDKAGLTDAIMEVDTARILAPNNQAFEDLLNMLGDDYNSIDDFDNETEITLLGNVLRYHVLLPSEGSIDLMEGAATTLFEDNFIDVMTEGGAFVFGDVTPTTASIVDENIDAKNGMVNIVDKVLLPQAALDFVALLESDDLATVISTSPELSILLEALNATELTEAFIDATNTSNTEDTEDTEDTKYTYFMPATVFAPTNAAFNELFNTLGDDYTSIASFDTEDEVALLKEILLGHVLEMKASTEDLEEGSLTTASGEDIEIIDVIGSEMFVIGDATNDINANITVADEMARNGIVHTVDKVLLSNAAVDFINELEEEEDGE